jgi:hypothetical protein
MASIAVTPEARKLADFSDPYYRTPARFVARRDSATSDVRPEQLEGKKVAVVGGTAHEAFLKTLFTKPMCGPLRRRSRRARRCEGARSICCSATAFRCLLAQRHRLAKLLRLSRRPLHRKPLFRRGRRHRGQARQRHAAPGVQLGAVPVVGKGPLQRSVAAVFSDQPFLMTTRRD